MSEYSALKATINANIKANNNHEITGAITNSVLNAMVNSLGAGYQFIGVATPTNPGSAQTPDYKCFYLATTPGTYTYLGGLVVSDGEVALLKWDSAWTKEVTGIASADKLNQLGQKMRKLTIDSSIGSSGDVISATGYGCMDFMLLNGAQTLIWRSGIVDPSDYKLAIYDENFVKLDYWSQGVGMDERTIDISSFTTAKYVRASFNLSVNNTFLKDENGNRLDYMSEMAVIDKAVEDVPNPISSNAVFPISASVNDLLFENISDSLLVDLHPLEIGGIDGTGQPTTTDERIRSVDFIPVNQSALYDNSFVITRRKDDIYRIFIKCYDSSLNYVGEIDNQSAESYVVALKPNTAFIKYVIRKNPSDYFHGVIPNEIYSFFKIWQVSNQSKIASLALDGILTNSKNQNFIEDCYISNKGYLIPSKGKKVSEKIPIISQTILWKYGLGVTCDTNAKLVVFDKNFNFVDFYTIDDLTTNSRTITLSQSVFENGAYLMFSFAGDGASLTQGEDVWTPKTTTKGNNVVEYLDVATYNIGTYRRTASYMSEDDKVGFLRQLKGWMNGELSKDILFIQEDLLEFVDGAETIKTYDTYFKQFFPYWYNCRPWWGSIYSKYPLQNCREIVYEYTTPGGTTDYRYHAAAEININGKIIGICSVHCNFYEETQAAEYEMLIQEMSGYDYVIFAGDFNCTVPQSEIGSNPVIENTFGKAGYKTANWGYWGNIYTQTDVGTPNVENQIDSVIVKGFDINSFKTLETQYYDHKPCMSNINVSKY